MSSSYWPPYYENDGSVSPPAARYSVLGVLDGGSTTPAGTELPATAGKFIPNPNTTTWMRISGTAARVGDTVLVNFAGNRSSSPANPATRRVSGAGPGEPGATVLVDSVVEFAISASNPDGNYATWVVVRQPQPEE